VRIADVFFRALLEDQQLQVDAVKAGDKAGQTLGLRMSKTTSAALGAGLKGGLAVLAGGAAIATKGMLELDGITAKFAADTGATADEAKAAGQAINEIAGRNLQSLGQVGDTMTAVRVQMGLTGDELSRVTELTLKYATATGQDSVTAVKAFDDIQDAWNLTSKDTQAIMDDLIASHQKYGGELGANQEALAKMAPQLTALNASWRDGIGLLNLFAASGLDSEKALTALNTAVKKLKPGQNLDDLVKEVSSIENPTLRAQKAIEIFGAKGGVALANALKPGVNSLKDFEISAGDAAGATDKAASSIENSLGNRFQLAIKGAGAAIIGFGQQFGPALTGLASVAALAGSLGGGKLAGALEKALSGGLSAVAKSAAVRGAAEAAGAAVGAAMSAAFAIGEKITEAAAEGLNAIAERSGLKVLASKAGAIIGAVFATAMKLAESIAESMTAAFVKLPFAPQVRAAVLAAGIELGTLQGTAFATAAGVALAALPLVLAVKLIPDITKFLEDVNPFLDQKGKDALHGFEQHMADEASKSGQPIGTALADSTMQGFRDGVAEGRATGPAAEKLGDQMVAAFKAQTPRVVDAVRSVVRRFSDAAGPNETKPFREALAKRLHEAGLRSAQSLAQGFKDGRDAVQNQWKSFLDILKNSETPMRQRAELLGELTSKALQKGLHAQDPYTRATAQTTKQVIIDELNRLQANAHNIGKKGMEFLRQGMKSKDPDIRTESHAIYNAATNSTKHLPATGTATGAAFGANIAGGISSKIYAGALAAYNLVREILKFTNRLPGKDYSAGPGPETRASGGRVAANQPYIVGELRPEIFVPDTAGTILPSVLSPIQTQPRARYADRAGGDTYIVNLLDKMQVRSVRDIGSGLRMLGEQGYLVPKRRATG
jgi:hypothetical protein